MAEHGVTTSVDVAVHLVHVSALYMRFDAQQAKLGLFTSGCVACFCPCIIYGKNKNRHDHLQRRGSPDPRGGGCCTFDCMLHGCVTGFGFGWVMQVREYVCWMIVLCF